MELLQDLVAAEAGQQDFEDNQARLPLLNDLEGILHFAARNIKPLHAELKLEQADHRRYVIDNQDHRLGCARFHRADARGPRKKR